MVAQGERIALCGRRPEPPRARRRVRRRWRPSAASGRAWGRRAAGWDPSPTTPVSVAHAKKPRDGGGAARDRGRGVTALGRLPQPLAEVARGRRQRGRCLRTSRASRRGRRGTPAPWRARAGAPRSDGGVRLRPSTISMAPACARMHGVRRRDPPRRPPAASATQPAAPAASRSAPASTDPSRRSSPRIPSTASRAMPRAPRDVGGLPPRAGAQRIQHSRRLAGVIPVVRRRHRASLPGASARAARARRQRS